MKSKLQITNYKLVASLIYIGAVWSSSVTSGTHAVENQVGGEVDCVQYVRVRVCSVVCHFVLFFRLRLTAETAGLERMSNVNINQSINQFICPNVKQTLDRTPREDATSANRCP